MNGTSSGSATSSNVTAPTIGGEFFFPSYQSGGYAYYDLTLGEVMAIKGTITDTIREKMEGYLAYKWGITLNSGHPWTGKSPYLDVASGADISVYWGSSDGGTQVSGGSTQAIMSIIFISIPVLLLIS